MLNGVKGQPLGSSFAVVAAGPHRRPAAAGAPCGIRNYSTAADSPSPARACFPPACPKSHRSPTTLPRQARQPQHSGYEPKVASSDLVRLDIASQFVPADVFH